MKSARYKCQPRSTRFSGLTCNKNSKRRIFKSPDCIRIETVEEKGPKTMSIQSKVNIA